MRESVLLHEESLRLQRMCRDLKKRDHLSTFLRRAHDAALDAYTRALGDDEFGQALDPPPILGIHHTSSVDQDCLHLPRSDPMSYNYSRIVSVLKNDGFSFLKEPTLIATNFLRSIFCPLFLQNS